MLCPQSLAGCYLVLGEGSCLALKEDHVDLEETFLSNLALSLAFSTLPHAFRRLWETVNRWVNTCSMTEVLGILIHHANSCASIKSWAGFSYIFMYDGFLLYLSLCQGFCSLSNLFSFLRWEWWSFATFYFLTRSGSLSFDFS